MAPGPSRRRLIALAVLAGIGAASQGARIAGGDRGVVPLVEFAAFVSILVVCAWSLYAGR